MATRKTKAQLVEELDARDARIDELKSQLAELETTTTMPQQRTLVEPPDVDTDVIAFVKKVLRPNGPKLTNVRFTGEPTDAQGLAHALGENLTWVANEPRQDARGCWWTNCITSADARDYSSRQYLDATSGPRDDEVAA